MSVIKMSLELCRDVIVPAFPGTLLLSQLIARKAIPGKTGTNHIPASKMGLTSVHIFSKSLRGPALTGGKAHQFRANCINAKSELWCSGEVSLSVYIYLLGVLVFNIVKDHWSIHCSRLHASSS